MKLLPQTAALVLAGAVAAIALGSATSVVLLAEAQDGDARAPLAPPPPDQPRVLTSEDIAQKVQSVAETTLFWLDVAAGAECLDICMDDPVEIIRGLAQACAKEDVASLRRVSAFDEQRHGELVAALDSACGVMRTSAGPALSAASARDLAITTGDPIRKAASSSRD